MSERTHQPLISMIDKNISFGGKNFKNMIETLQAKPGILNNVISDFDSLIYSYNQIKISDIDSETFPNLYILKNYTQKLPKISNLEKDAKIVESLRDSTKDTLHLVDKLFETNKWQFNQKIENPRQLAIAFILETYGKFAFKNDYLFPVLALEELIAIKREKFPKLYKAVDSWYTKEEGFSDKFIRWLVANETPMYL